MQTVKIPGAGELVLKGKVDKQARRLALDEIASGGSVTGHLELIVLGHVAGKTAIIRQLED